MVDYELIIYKTFPKFKTLEKLSMPLLREYLTV